MHSTLILDLDGTLLDTLDDLGAAMNHTLSSLGLPTHDRESFRLMVGRGMRDFLTRATAPAILESADFETALATFLSYYRTHQEATQPYPGMLDFLEKASGVYRLVVYTNKEQSSTETVMQKYFLDIPFERILGHREGVPLKPDPQALLELVQKNSWNKDHLCYVGDSEVDVETALRAGIRFIGVLWGFRTKQTLSAAGGKKFAQNAEELKRVLGME